MRNYRSRLDIIANILEVADQNASKTRIMYQANLNYKVLQKYLKEVTVASLISFKKVDGYFVLTPKGKLFLEIYNDYAKMRKRVEKRLRDVYKKRTNLEELCSNK